MAPRSRRTDSRLSATDCLFAYESCMDRNKLDIRQTCMQSNMQASKQTDRQTDRQTETDGRTDRQTDSLFGQAVLVCDGSNKGTAFYFSTQTRQIPTKSEHNTQNQSAPISFLAPCSSPYFRPEYSHRGSSLRLKVFLAMLLKKSWGKEAVAYIPFCVDTPFFWGDYGVGGGWGPLAEHEACMLCGFALEVLFSKIRDSMHMLCVVRSNPSTESALETDSYACRFLTGPCLCYGRDDPDFQQRGLPSS